MEQPLWKKAYDAAERQTAPALEKLLAKPDVLEAISLSMAVRRRAREDVAQLIERQLHALNLPSAADLRSLSNQIAGIERQLRLLDRRIDAIQAANGGADNGDGGAARPDAAEDDDG